jgi:hypothetical protein
MPDPILDFYDSMKGGKKDDDPILSFYDGLTKKGSGTTGKWDAQPSAMDQVKSGAKNLLQAFNPAPLVNAIAHPVETAKGLLDTRPQFTKAANAFAKAIPGGKVEPSVMEESPRSNALMEGVYNSVAAIPVVGPMAHGITQAIASDVNQGDYGGAAGTALGTVLAPKVMGKGANAFAERIAPHLRSSAQSQYAKIFSNRAKDAAVLERATPEMIKRGITFKDPKADLADLALVEGKKAAANKANVLAAHEAQGATIPVPPVVQRLDLQRARLNNSTGPVSPAADRASRLYDDLSGRIQTEAVVGPNGPTQGQALGIGPAEKFRKQWAQSARDTHNNPAATVMESPEVYKAAANAIRAEINQLPGMKGANREVGFWRDVERLSEHAPQSKTIGQVAGEGATRVLGESAWGFLHPGMLVKSAGEALRTIRAATKTPQWRSASAVQKTKIADYLETGQVGPAMEELGYIMQGANGNEYLMNMMTTGQQ